MGRMERVNEQMRREIGTMLQQDFQDPRLKLVTILHVDVSKDLRHAVVFYSVLGEEKKIQEVGAVLERLRGYVRKLVGERISMRYTPEIRFEYDQSVAYGAQIEKTIQEIHDQALLNSKKNGSKDE